MNQSLRLCHISCDMEEKTLPFLGVGTASMDIQPKSVGDCILGISLPSVLRDVGEIIPWDYLDEKMPGTRTPFLHPLVSYCFFCRWCQWSKLLQGSSSWTSIKEEQKFTANALQTASVEQAFAVDAALLRFLKARQ